MESTYQVVDEPIAHAHLLADVRRHLAKGHIYPSAAVSPHPPQLRVCRVFRRAWTEYISVQAEVERPMISHSAWLFPSACPAVTGVDD